MKKDVTEMKKPLFSDLIVIIQALYVTPSKTNVCIFAPSIGVSRSDSGYNPGVSSSDAFIS